MFFYLSEEESADVYLYLSSYRPYQWATLEPVMAASQHDAGPPEEDPPSRVVSASFAAGSEPAKVVHANDAADMQFVALLTVAGVLVSLLLASGFGFTIRECMRLSAEGKDRELASDKLRVGAANAAGAQVDDRLVA